MSYMSYMSYMLVYILKLLMLLIIEINTIYGKIDCVQSILVYMFSNFLDINSIIWS